MLTSFVVIIQLRWQSLTEKKREKEFKKKKNFQKDILQERTEATIRSDYASVPRSPSARAAASPSSARLIRKKIAFFPPSEMYRDCSRLAF